MNNELNILMVDDHPMIIEGYKNAILKNYTGPETFQIDIAFDCDEALEALERNVKVNPYDLALIDIQLPPSADGSITSGEGLSKKVRALYPKAKIIVLTMHNESSRIHNILQSVDPEGFLIKSDLSSDELLRAFTDVIAGKTYYSATVNDHFRKMIANNFTLDQKNLQILHHLSKGIRTKNLPKYISLSLSAIEKRKNHIKELFNMKTANDEMLIEEARNRGFV